jgi:hypothetical protein
LEAGDQGIDGNIRIKEGEFGVEAQRNIAYKASTNVV